MEENNKIAEPKMTGREPGPTASLPALDQYKIWRMVPTDMYQHSEFICGWGAAFVNISVTFPINKVMFRQQLYGVRSFKAIKQLQKEGLKQLYRGLLPPLLQKTTSMSLMFGLYYKFQHWIAVAFPSLWSPANKTAAAMLAGTVEATLTPFERIQVLMQDKNYQPRFNNTIDAFRQLKAQYGWKEFYRGQTPILLRNGPSNVLFFLGRDYLKAAYPDLDSESKKVLLDFVSGAVLGATISTICYPVNVVKVRMQSKLGGEFDSFWEATKVVLKERNYSLKKIYRGLHVNYTRSFISWGIINATYEFMMKNIFHKENTERFW